MNELLLNPDQYDDPATIALQKNAAEQTAVERLLGAPKGSMPIIDNETLMAWFTDQAIKNQTGHSYKQE